MPTTKSLTLGYRDLAQARKALAGSAQQLDPEIKKLKDIKTAPDLKGDEVAALTKAVETLIKLQLRREFPILERVIDNLLDRLQTGAAVEPLTQLESRALVELMGTLSDVENEALHFLKDVGLIRASDWSDVVEPHRKDSNAAQRAEVKKVKWGALFFANGIAPALAAVALSMVVPGAAGAIGAIGVATGMGLAISPKISAKIEVANRTENRSLGMNVVEGRETISEPVLLTARLADGAVFDGNVIDNLQTEAALATLLLESRARAGVAWGSYETEFLKIAGTYQAAIEALAEGQKTAPLSSDQLRRELFDVRAQLMAPSQIESLVRTVGAVNVPSSDNSRLCIAERQVANLFELIKTQVDAGGPEAQSTATFVMNALPLMDELVQGSISPDLRKVATRIAAGETLGAADKKVLANEVGELNAYANEFLREYGLGPSGAEDRAREAVGQLIAQVLPSFGEASGDPKFRDVHITKTTDAGFVVSGAFKSGLFGQEGSFSLEVGKDGTVAMQSLEMDVGPKRARNVAEAAAKEAARMLNPKAEGKVALGGVTGGGKDNYVIDVTVDGKRSKVEVSPLGLVDWATIAV